MSRPGVRTRLVGWFGQCALALLALTLGLLALEAWARFELARQDRPNKQNERAKYTDFDALLGWVKRPGARAVYRRPEYTVEVAVNSHGLRDPERGYEPAGAWRLLALGDSFVEGYAVPLEQTVSQVLERSLQAAGCRAEVINGGTGGYSTDQEYLFYGAEGLKYGPRIVLLFFFHNDVPANAQVNYFGVRKPRLMRTARGLEGVNLPLLPPAPKPSAEASPSDVAPAAGSGWALLEWARGRLWRGAPGMYNALARRGLWPARRKEPEESLRVYERDPPARVAQGWRVTRDVLSQLGQDVAQAGGRLLVLYVPSRFEVEDGAWTLTRETYGVGGEGWDRHAPRRRLETITGKLGLAFLDLTPALEQADSTLLGGTYFPIDGHWNARGHRAAAQAVERALGVRGWLAGCPPVAR